MGAIIVERVRSELTAVSALEQYLREPESGVLGITVTGSLQLSTEQSPPSLRQRWQAARTVGFGCQNGIGLKNRRDVMLSRNNTRLLVIITLVLLVTSAAVSKPRKMQRIHPGTWGGSHIRIEVGAGSATIDYDCANGTIDRPFTIDARGRFSWRGTHNREHGGPIRIDEKPNGRPAIYSGTIKGDIMTLTVKFADTNEVLDTFTLKRGSSGRVVKCK